MKTDPNEDDSSLRKLLREWPASTPLPPHFQEQVWGRIAAAETPAKTQGTGFLAWLQLMFARPAFVTACATVFMLAGVSAGWLRARGQTARIDTSLSTRYVQSVDPYQTPR